MEKKTGIFTNGVIWFGVAISVSEIEAGIEIGSATSENIYLPLLLGHILGGLLLFAIGFIGAKTRQNAMETTVASFGNYFSKFFAFLNVLQLIGWIAVLNAQGALALSDLDVPVSFPVICIVLALTISLWVLIGLSRTKIITTVVMLILTLLLLVLTMKLHISSASVASSANITFWTIFEVSIAMPLSWLPVISDYTKDVKNPVGGTCISALSYTIASLWMYYIGILIAKISPECNIAQAIMQVGIGIPGIIIIALSTITTNFLAANSAGESTKTLSCRINPKIAAVIVCFVSTILAISGIVEHYIDFLYLIASVFAPMGTVLIVSFYFVKEHLHQKFYLIWNFFSWLLGFLAYQIALKLELSIAPTLVAIVVSAAMTLCSKSFSVQEKDSSISIK